MSLFPLHVQFGEAEFYREFDHNGALYLFVIEGWRGCRWMILYCKRGQDWVVAERYTVCRSADLYWIPQEHGSRLYSGTSVDRDGSYLTVERGDHILLSFYDSDVKYGCLLDTMEVPSLSLVPLHDHHDLESPLSDDAVIQLRGMLPVMANICEVYLVELVVERVAYMVEDTGFHRRLYRYTWIEGHWVLEGPFETVRNDGRDIARSLIANIVGVYEGYTSHGRLQVVTEDGLILWRWHTYHYHTSGWHLRYSHHALKEYGDDELIEFEDERSL
jgi:hypothetical protein